MNAYLARKTLGATARAKQGSPWEEPTQTRLPSTSCRLSYCSFKLGK